MAYTNGAATRPTTTDAVYSIALKIGRTIIEGAKIKSHYSDFDKSPLEFGGIIEDLKVVLKSSTTYNPSATSLSVSYDTIVKRYFGSWSAKRFDTEVNRSVAKAVVTGEAQLSDLVAQIINNLTESEKAEANDIYKAFFLTEQTTATAVNDRLVTVYANDTAKGSGATSLSSLVNASSYLPANSLYEMLDQPTVDEVLTEVRNIVKDMEYKNSTYQGVSTFPCEASMEDLRIVVPFKWLNKVDVEKMANLFNMDKASMLAKIIETDGLEWNYADATATTGEISAAHGYGIIICDKNAIGRVTKGREMENTFVKERFTQWYGLHFDEMFYYNPLLKCYCILFADSKTVA